MNKTFTQKKISTSQSQKVNEVLENASDFTSEPDANIINNILNYSKALSIRKSKNVEYIETVLN